MDTLICFSSGRGVIPWVIRKVTKSDVNHVFLMYKSEYWGRWLAIDIDEGGPVPTRCEKVFAECSTLRVFCSTMDLRVGVRKNMHRLNRGYDWLGVVGFLCAYMKSWFTGKRVRNVLHSSGRDFCSEYVAHVIEDSGDRRVMADPESVSPGMLRDFVSGELEYREISLSEISAFGIVLPGGLVKEPRT